MIYLDNAATTWPKPRGTGAAVAEVLSSRGANPGRGSYRMAELSSELVYRCRCRAAEFFGAKAPERVIFTPSCTHSINYVLKGLLSAGDHVIISDMEHNAVSRPVMALAKKGVQFSVAHVEEGDAEATVAAFRRAMRVNTKLIFCTHASNVFGIKLPIAKIGQLAHRNGILFGVDCAQSAGTAPLDLAQLPADFLCMPAHKGLYGMMGLGLLIVNCDTKLATVIEGGTGSLSGVNVQPEFLPDRLESGTLNVPAIAALEVGMNFISSVSRERLEAHEMSLICRAYDALSSLPECELYTQRPRSETHVPLLSFNIKGIPSDDAAGMLGERDIAVRAGLHCAGEAHRAKGTQSTGTIRICPSVFTSSDEIDAFLAAVREIAEKRTEHPR
ncbi:MAG: aminotransferase class V-fold PLP-dependent enzyme [Clostridia bacterium]|nr:aminotransferase class V-fold PLP-dependent enzyme [Clostridia bacterium]